MRKKALLALMMAAILLLSGCALIKKDQAVDDATEIIRMGDQVITKKEVLAQAEQELYDQYSMYSMFNYSYDVTDPANIQAFQSRYHTLITNRKNRKTLYIRYYNECIHSAVKVLLATLQVFCPGRWDIIPFVPYSPQYNNRFPPVPGFSPVA